jgi:hypothetical protein
MARVHQPLYLLPRGLRLPGKGRRGQRPVPAPMALVAHLAGLRLQGFPTGLRRPLTLGPGLAGTDGGLHRRRDALPQGW